MAAFRKHLKEKYGLPVKVELHTRPLLMNKNPYRQLGLSGDQRRDIVSDACRMLSSLPLRFINVVIVKPNIMRRDYRVLDRALTYAIQRVENDLQPARHPENKFLIVTDRGREGVMRKTARRLRKINYIPSRFSDTSYQQPIRTLIEDPLPKDSRESYYIQYCDMVSYLVYLHGLFAKLSCDYSRRLAVSHENVQEYLDMLKPCLNRSASREDPHGIIFTPRPA